MNWYIVDGEEKIGPFAKDELKRYIGDGPIDSSSMVMSENMTEPMPYSAIFQSEAPSDMPPLPPLPDDMPPPPSAPKAPSSARFDQEVSEKLDSLPKLASLPSSSSASTPSTQIGPDETDYEVEVLDEDLLDNSMNIDHSSKRSIIISLVLLTSLILGIGGYFYFKNYTPYFERPPTMSLLAYRDATEILKADKLKARVFLSGDKRSLWLVTNNFSHGDVSLELTSIDDQVLSQKPVKLQSISYLRDGVAHFDKLVFENGDKLVDGEYIMSIKTQGKLRSSFMYFLKDLKTQFEFRKKTLISNESRDEFESKLKDFKSKTDQNSVRFTRELIQKYLTLQTMVNQIKEGFLESFGRSNATWDQRIKTFENEYKTKYGPFFTSFVIANDKQYDEINEQSFSNKVEIVSDYTRLSRLAKQVGQVAVSALERLEKFDFKAASVEQTMELKESIIKNFDAIIEQCETKLAVLQNS